MRKYGFTLMELLIVVVIVGTLAAIGFSLYNNAVSSSNEKICGANLKALKTALDLYALDHDMMPSSLAEIPSEYIDRAYAQVMRQKDSWQIKLAIFFNNLRENGLAYADFITNLAKGDLRTITCPGDSTKPASGGISYGFNSGLIAPISSYNYGRIDPSVVLIADCDGATFAGVGQISSDRHIKYTFAGSSSSGLAITRGGNLGRSKTWSVTQRGFLGRRITVTTGVINDINDANITYTTTITYN